MPQYPITEKQATQARSLVAQVTDAQRLLNTYMQSLADGCPDPVPDGAQVGIHPTLPAIIVTVPEDA